MIMTIFASIAEFERDLISERTGAGRKWAQEWGVKFGRPVKRSREQQALALRLLDEGQTPVRDIAKAFRVDCSTIYRLRAYHGNS
jgi:DNA invertase Pin-like site-specific DNA recombinase